MSGENLDVNPNSENEKDGTSNDAKKSEDLNEIYFISLFQLLLFHKILC